MVFLLPLSLALGIALLAGAIVLMMREVYAAERMLRPLARPAQRNHGLQGGLLTKRRTPL